MALAEAKTQGTMQKVMQQAPETARLDKWLWCARFFKTRGLAVDEINRGRVQVNERAAKPGRDLKPGDILTFRQGPITRTVQVLELAKIRGPASVAQTLYRETAESLEQREQIAEQRRFAPEPGESLRHGRPTKRNRRELGRAGMGVVVHDDRWSTSLRD